MRAPGRRSSARVRPLRYGAHPLATRLCLASTLALALTARADTVPLAEGDEGWVDAGQSSVSWEVREVPEGTNNTSKITAAPDSDATDSGESDLSITQRLDMFAGEVRMLGVVKLDRIAIGNGRVIRAEVLGTGELLLIGQSVGSTSLRLWHRDGRQSDYNIRVSEKDPEMRVRLEPMVRMKVQMIEFRKSALRQLGIDWSDSASGPGFAVAGDIAANHVFRPAAEGFAASLPNQVAPFTTYFGIASNITSRINLLASNGDATTLAEPVLSCASGSTASFLAGGEVPYPSVGSNGQTVVQFKEYGIRLTVSPLIDMQGNVRTRVQTEISQLDPAVSIQGAPGLLTRRAETEVNVRDGETIVISGLLTSEQSRDMDMMPGIGRLPVIGQFFRNENRRHSLTELVIFLTPEIIDPRAPDALVNARQQRFHDEASARLDRARNHFELLD